MTNFVGGAIFIAICAYVGEYLNSIDNKIVVNGRIVGDANIIPEPSIYPEILFMIVLVLILTHLTNKTKGE